jgi:hypothetical protein
VRALSAVLGHSLPDALADAKRDRERLAEELIEADTGAVANAQGLVLPAPLECVEDRTGPDFRTHMARVRSRRHRASRGGLGRPGLGEEARVKEVGVSDTPTPFRRPSTSTPAPVEGGSPASHLPTSSEGSLVHPAWHG